MEDDSIKKLLFNQIKYLVKDLEDAAKEVPLDKELVKYSEGKLNGCIEAYFKLFPCVSIPDSLWNNIVYAWNLARREGGGRRE